MAAPAPAPPAAKRAMVELIVEASRPQMVAASTQPRCPFPRSQEAALRHKLSNMQLSTLRRKALEVGVDPDALEDAMDARQSPRRPKPSERPWEHWKEPSQWQNPVAAYTGVALAIAAAATALASLSLSLVLLLLAIAVLPLFETAGAVFTRLGKLRGALLNLAPHTATLVRHAPVLWPYRVALLCHIEAIAPHIEQLLEPKGQAPLLEPQNLNAVMAQLGLLLPHTAFLAPRVGRLSRHFDALMPGAPTCS